MGRAILLKNGPPGQADGSQGQVFLQVSVPCLAAAKNIFFNK
jgi:hypothetical protein